MTTTVERLQIEMDMKAQGVSSDLIALIRLVQSMEREAKKAAAGPKAVEKALKSIVKPAKDVQAELSAVEKHVKSMAMRIDTATSSVKNLGSAFNSAARFSRNLRELSRPFVAVAGEIYDGAKAFVRTMSELETAFVSVTKTVDEAVDANGKITKSYADIREELRVVAAGVPVATEELFRLGGAAGQLGVEAENLSSFVETAAKLGIATDLSAEKAATGLAKLSAVMGTSHSMTEAYGSVMVRLGNNMATGEAAILSTAQRMSGLAKTIGLTTEELLAFSAASSALGMSPMLSSGAFQRVFLEVNSAVKSGSEDLRTYAMVAGQSADQFAQKWANAPAQAMLDFLAGLNQFIARGGDVNALFDELGLKGTQNIQVFTRAAGGAEEYAKALGLARNEMGLFSSGQTQNSALNQEADKQARTLAGTYTRLTNEVKSTIDVIGESGLGQALTRVLEYVLENVESFRQWIKTSEDFKKILEEVDSFVDNQFLPGLGSGFGSVSSIWTDKTTDLETKVTETLKSVGRLAGQGFTEAIRVAVEAAGPEIAAAVGSLFIEALKLPFTGWGEILGTDKLAFLLNDQATIDEYYGKNGGYHPNKDILKGGKELTPSADGNLLQGPVSGFLAMLHGREWVIPDNPGQNPYMELARLRGDKLPGFATGKNPYTASPGGIVRRSQRDLTIPTQRSAEYLAKQEADARMAVLLQQDLSVIASSFVSALGRMPSFLEAKIKQGLALDRPDKLGGRLFQGDFGGRDIGSRESLSVFEDVTAQMRELSGVSSDARQAMMEAADGFDGPLKDSIQNLIAAVPQQGTDFFALEKSPEFQSFLSSLPNETQSQLMKTILEQQQAAVDKQNEGFDEWLDFASGLGGAKDEFDGWLESMNQVRGAIDELPEALLGAVPEPIRAPFGGAQLVGETPAGTQIFRPEQFQAFQQQLSNDVLRRQLEVEKLLSSGSILNFEGLDLGDTFKNLPSELVSRITKEWLDKNLNRFVAGNAQGATNQQAMQELFKHLMDLSMKQQGLGIFDIQKARQEMMLADISKQTDLAGLSDRAYLEKYGVATEMGTEAMNEAANLNRVMSASVAGSIPSLDAMRAGLDLAAIEVEGMRVAGMGLRNSMARLTSQLGGPAAPTDAIPPAGSSGALAASRYSQPLQLVVQMNSRTITDEVIKDFGRRQRTNVGIRG